MWKLQNSLRFELYCGLKFIREKRVMNKLLKASELNLRSLLELRFYWTEMFGKKVFFLCWATAGSILNGLSVFEFVVKFKGYVRSIFFLAEITLNISNLTWNSLDIYLSHRRCFLCRLLIRAFKSSIYASVCRSSSSWSWYNICCWRASL